MFTVSLHPDQNITFKVRDSIYYSTIKRAYQTFHGRKNFFIFHEGKWLPASIIMREVLQHPIYRIDFNGEVIYCDQFLKLFTDGKEIEIAELDKGDFVDVNMHLVDKIKRYQEPKIEITNITKLEETSSWLFGIQFQDETIESYPLTNGIIVK